MLTAGVGDDERVRVARHVHDEAVADPPLGSDAALTRDHCSHDLVGVETALHQRFNAARGNEADCLCGGIVAVRRRDEFERH